MDLMEKDRDYWREQVRVHIGPDYKALKENSPFRLFERREAAKTGAWHFAQENQIWELSLDPEVLHRINLRRGLFLARYYNGAIVFEPLQNRKTWSTGFAGPNCFLEGELVRSFE